MPDFETVQTPAEPNRPGQYPKFVWDIVWSIVHICLLCMPAGVVSLVMAILAQNAWERGDIAGFEKNRNVGKKARVVGLIIGILLVALTLLVFFFSVFVSLAAISGSSGYLYH